ncbi:MAG: LysR family transcriptional regulator [Polyangiales bacterium]
MKAKTQDLEAVRWDDVRVFLAVYRAGSLGQAALRLAMDTSTVSRRLSAFEDGLAVRLFDRARDGIQPTRAAKGLLAAAEAMEAAHARLAREAGDVDAVVQGVVRLSMPPGLADPYIASALPRLLAQHPKLTVEIDASARVLDLARHETDLALRSVRPESAQLVAQKLFARHPWVVACAPALAKQLGKVRDWSTLRWIGWDRDLASFGPARWLSKHVPNAAMVLRTSHFASQLAAVGAGLGVALVPEVDRRHRGLAQVDHARTLAPSVAALPRDDLWLVGHQAQRELPRIDAVWRFLRDELLAQVDWK